MIGNFSKIDIETDQIGPLIPINFSEAVVETLYIGFPCIYIYGHVTWVIEIASL